MSAATLHQLMKLPQIYSVGRLASTATKPAILYFCTMLGDKSVAEAVAVVYIAITLSLVFTAADPHRRYYSAVFDSTKTVNGLSYFIYFFGCLILALLGMLVVTGILIGSSTFSLLLILSAICYFCSEKIADEVLRYSLFEKNFTGWGAYSLLRSILQAAFLIPVVFIPELRSGWMVVFSLTLANAIVFASAISWRSSTAIFARGKVSWHLLRRSIRSLVRNRTLWLIAVVGASIGYLDRTAMLFLDPSLLPSFTLTVMSFSVVLMSIDFFYLSLHRREFLEQTLSLSMVLKSTRFYLSVAGGLVVGCTACAVLFYTLPDAAQNLSIPLIIAVAIIQTSVGMSLIPHQILYWKTGYQIILGVDLTFWVGVLTFMGIVFQMGPNVATNLLGLSALVVCRMFALSILAGFSKNSSTSEGN